MSTPATYRRYEDAVEKVVGNPKPQKKSSTTYTPPPKQEPTKDTTSDKQTVPDTHTMTREVVPIKRGAFTFSHVQVKTKSMLGLLDIYDRRELPYEYKVYPSTSRLKNIEQEHIVLCCNMR